MQSYELLYIIPAKLEEAERHQVTERVSQLISQLNGKIKDHNTWLTRKLSYPINHIRQGIFRLAHFSIPPDQIAALRQELKIDADIIRYSIVKPVQSLSSTRQPQTLPKVLPQEAQQILNRQTQSAPESEEMTEKEKVSLEELDKKLEELLSDENQIK